jgi:acyl-CoA synthetase (NDP forming)
MSQEDAFAVLQAYGIPIAPVARVHDAAEAVREAARLGWPVVLKAADARIVHKSDVGGVALDLCTPGDVERALAGMRDSIRRGAGLEVEAFVVQRQAPPGREVILGVTHDPLFGPLVMFGSGGRYVEVFRDVTHRVLPLTDVDAHEMIRATKGYALLSGFRGEPPVDLVTAEEMILRVAQLVSDFDCVQEMDVNPFLLAPQRADCMAVDVRIRVAAREEPGGQEGGSSG